MESSDLDKLIKIAPALLGILTILVGIATSVIVHIKQKRKDRKIANRETYLKLELASIDLFRFEADKLEIIRPIWEGSKKRKTITVKSPDHSSNKTTDNHIVGIKAEDLVRMNYVCQILNLFELSLKFREEKVLPKDVFGSWVAWYYLLINAPGFPEIWEDVKWDYIPDLRKIINEGLKIVGNSSNSSDDEKRSKFYKKVSEIVKCDIVADWTDNTEDTPYDDYWEKNKIHL